MVRVMFDWSLEGISYVDTAGSEKRRKGIPGGMLLGIFM